MSERSKEAPKDVSPEQRQKAEAFLAKHMFADRPEEVYTSETLSEWNEGDRKRNRPFWGRTVGGDAWSFHEHGAPVMIDYMWFRKGEDEPISFGEMVLHSGSVDVFLPNPDIKGVAEPVQASSERYTLDAVARAIELVEESFAQTYADFEAVKEIEELSR